MAIDTVAVTEWSASAMQAFSGNLIELAILFLVLAVIAAVAGAQGVAGLSMQVAKWFVIIFVVLAVVTFLI